MYFFVHKIDMKLFINKNKFLNTLKKELPTYFENKEINKISLLTSKSLYVEGNDKENYHLFKEIFKIKGDKEIAYNATSDKKLFKHLNRRLSKHFSYLGRRNYNFKLNQIYNRKNSLILEFLFSRK
ncbi:MAG: hypothetical protein HPAVJP_1160 [Candidatus Hepatoplasma vulgare]|nr:MAG: hypothetical protein HPAVJP_1160 [Candidatus Hepatoplasma sp.]